jgi:hypothetical protein
LHSDAFTAAANIPSCRQSGGMKWTTRGVLSAPPERNGSTDRGMAAARTLTRSPIPSLPSVGPSGCKGRAAESGTRTEQETEEAAFERMLRNRAAAVPKDKLTAEMIENPRYGLKPRELIKEEADRLDALPIDYSDIPPLGDEFFSKALWTGKSPETQSDAGNAET